jgi:hypothetical protein
MKGGEPAERRSSSPRSSRITIMAEWWVVERLD